MHLFHNTKMEETMSTVLCLYCTHQQMFNVNVYQLFIPTISEPAILGSLATWGQWKRAVNTTLSYYHLLS